jgi:Rps23 Pro-64 3,4-dihydroxylase Tpa1-like proline 4-hydroxylase
MQGGGAALSSLASRVGSCADDFRSAEPFPNVVIDDAVDERTLVSILKSFPKMREMSTQFDGRHEIKSAENEWQRIPELARALLAQLNSAEFLDALEELSGIRGLIADSRLIGGGLHQIGRGGKLNVHADFNYFEATRLHRRLNVLLYLNRNWKSEWGGQLELWTHDLAYCQRSIEPLFNRMVIFATTSTSFHGHPKPLTCPPDVTRKSLALYYYTAYPGPDAQDAHSTLFHEVPEG